MRLWFCDAVSGPICVTKTLELIHCGEGIQSDAVMNGTTSQIKSFFGGKNFWKFKLDYMILMVQNHHIMSGAECESMDFSPEVKYNYIGLRDLEQNLQRVSEGEIQEFKTAFVKDNSKTENNGFYPVAVVNNSKKMKLKLEHGTGVFFRVQDELLKVINTRSFCSWCLGTEEVKWDLWFGMDEQDNSSDYRTLKNENW